METETIPVTVVERFQTQLLDDLWLEVKTHRYHTPLEAVLEQNGAGAENAGASCRQDECQKA